MMEIETRHEQCADESVRKQRLPGRGDSFMKLETAQREHCLRRGLRLNGGGFISFLKSESSGFQELVGRSQGRESV